MLTLGSQPTMLLNGVPISEANKFLYDFGFVPSCVADYFGVATHANPLAMRLACPPDHREPVQVFTAMFVHAGWAHIFGNMLFLWIFGDNVEDRMGHGRYLLFYIVCGLVAAITQIAMATSTTLPSVGASGAIAGVLAGYLILYPKAIVQVVILPLFFLPFFVPAVVLIGVWFLMQLFAGVLELGQTTTAGSGVAWWAHVGGFACGAVLIWFFKRSQAPPEERFVREFD